MTFISVNRASPKTFDQASPLLNGLFNRYAYCMDGTRWRRLCAQLSGPRRLFRGMEFYSGSTTAHERRRCVWPQSTPQIYTLKPISMNDPNMNTFFRGPSSYNIVISTWWSRANFRDNRDHHPFRPPPRSPTRHYWRNRACYQSFGENSTH